MIGVGIVGAGLQGRRRADALTQIPDARLVAITDKDHACARMLASRYGCEGSEDWRNTVRNQDVDLVIVCTPNSTHAEIGIAAMNAGKHVLCEKPLATTLHDAEQMVETSQSQGVSLWCGFNLRYHPAISQALRWKSEGAVGELMFIRSLYGICGREDYDKDWRMRQELSGGGQLMDQGMHVLDLCRVFGGPFTEVKGYVSTAFWNASVEDNAFAIMKTKQNLIAVIHVSWTQWKNLFLFEVSGKDALISAQGLGGSYGDERVSLVKRPGKGQPFEEALFEFRGADDSWKLELFQIIQAIGCKCKSGNATEGVEALRLARAIYESSKTGHAVRV
jgi:predicted dehydrogenase